MTRSFYLWPLILLSAILILSYANWVSEPEQQMKWLTVALIYPLGMIFARVIAVRTNCDEAETRLLSRSLTGAGGILLASLGVQLAENLGFLEPAWGDRLVGIFIGLLYILIGNNLPKSLFQSSRPGCTPKMAYQTRLFAGWAFVLTGLAYIGLTVFASPAVADRYEDWIIFGGLGLIALRLVAARFLPRTT